MPTWPRTSGLVLSAALLAGCASGPLAVFGGGQPPETCQARRVVIGSFGTDDWARHFSVALAAELRDEGFTVVEESAETDLRLTGLVTMTAAEGFRFSGLMGGASGRYEKGARPMVSVEARRPTGEPVWSRHYASEKRKTLGDWAEDAAEDLRKACERNWRP